MAQATWCIFLDKKASLDSTQKKSTHYSHTAPVMEGFTEQSHMGGYSYPHTSRLSWAEGSSGPDRAQDGQVEAYV